MQLINDDMLIALKAMEDNSVHAVVTDPPYGISFMKERNSWDYQVPSVEQWIEVLRVLRPGGYLLSFGGTRTYHRTVVNIEDAGFEIRDQLIWLYSQGFPKNRNFPKYDLEGELQQEWDGYGTHLKPAFEPICLAMKPLEGTFAENVAKWGTGGININDCRVPLTNGEEITINTFNNGAKMWGDAEGEEYASRQETDGRWPANIILDENAAMMLDVQSGTLKSGKFEKHHQNNSEWIHRGGERRELSSATYGDTGGASRFFYCAKPSRKEKDAGLERFEYVSVGRGFSESDPHARRMGKNPHVTVKPIELMKYLVKLIAPPEGIVLDPFMGSGTTGIGCIYSEVDFIGIDIDNHYCQVAEARIAHWQKKYDTRQLSLF